MNLLEKLFPKETKYISNESFILNMILFIVYIALSVLTYLVVGDFLHMFLIWNLFLATIPYAISFFIEREVVKSKIAVIISLVLWLFFFPNSIYIITDLIYTNRLDFMNLPGMYEITIYMQNLPAYLGLFHIYLGSILGLIYGFKSLSVLYELSKNTRLKKYKDLITVCIFILSGVGIYIGRFFRYNSWEFLKVFRIVSDFFASFSWFTVFFVLALALLQTIIFYGVKINFKKKSLIE